MESQGAWFDFTLIFLEGAKEFRVFMKMLLKVLTASFRGRCFRMDQSMLWRMELNWDELKVDSFRQSLIRWGLGIWE